MGAGTLPVGTKHFENFAAGKLTLRRGHVSSMHGHVLETLSFILLPVVLNSAVIHYKHNMGIDLNKVIDMETMQ